MPKPKPKPPPNPIAALEAKLRLARGEKLRPGETALVAAYDRAVAHEAVEAFLNAVPKGVYCSLAGRQQKVVDEFADRYDIPIDGPSINLYDVISALHSRISELAKAARPNLELGDVELEREKLKQEVGKLQRQCDLLDIDIGNKMDKLVERDSLRAGMEWLSARLRALGSSVHRVAGEEGLECVNEFLDALSVELEKGGAVHW